MPTRNKKKFFSLINSCTLTRQVAVKKCFCINFFYVIRNKKPEKLSDLSDYLRKLCIL